MFWAVYSGRCSSEMQFLFNSYVIKREFSHVVFLFFLKKGSASAHLNWTFGGARSSHMAALWAGAGVRWGPAAVWAPAFGWTLLECGGGTRLGFTSRCLLFFSSVFLTLFRHLFSSPLRPSFSSFFPPPCSPWGAFPCKRRVHTLVLPPGETVLKC